MVKRSIENLGEREMLRIHELKVVFLLLEFSQIFCSLLITPCTETNKQTKKPEKNKKRFSIRTCEFVLRYDVTVGLNSPEDSRSGDMFIAYELSLVKEKLSRKSII